MTGLAEDLATIEIGTCSAMVFTLKPDSESAA